MASQNNAPLDAVLRVRDPSPAVRIFQHARRLEIAREQGKVDVALHEFNLMQRVYHEHFQTPMAEGRRVRGFLPVTANGASEDRAAQQPRPVFEHCTAGCWLLPGHEGECDWPPLHSDDKLTGPR